MTNDLLRYDRHGVKMAYKSYYFHASNSSVYCFIMYILPPPPVTDHFTWNGCGQFCALHGKNRIVRIDNMDQTTGH